MSDGGVIRMIGDILCENVSVVYLYKALQVWTLPTVTLPESFHQMKVHIQDIRQFNLPVLR